MVHYAYIMYNLNLIIKLMLLFVLSFLGKENHHKQTISMSTYDTHYETSVTFIILIVKKTWIMQKKKKKLM